tara:strand:+ start:456 stop:632 length:177 start_codon:yes stop_codon:yes gene_type:complete
MNNTNEILGLIKDMNGVQEKLIENQRLLSNQLKIMQAQIKLLQGQKLTTEELEKLTNL